MYKKECELNRYKIEIDISLNLYLGLIIYK